jgi:hypothetical protein
MPLSYWEDEQVKYQPKINEHVDIICSHSAPSFCYPYTKGDIVVPLVYNYYDANGTCDEYHLVPITHCSSGAFWDWYEFKNNAKEVQALLNEALSRGEIGYDELRED